MDRKVPISKLTGSAPDAIRYALKLLSYRGRSVRELKERLRKKGYDEASVEAAVERLSAAGFLDDAALAGNLRRIASEQRLLGSLGTRQLLRRRGISEDLIREVVVADDAADLQLCLQLAQRRVRITGMPVTPAETNRLFHYLARRGYGPAVIRKCLRDLGRDVED